MLKGETPPTPFPGTKGNAPHLICWGWVPTLQICLGWVPTAHPNPVLGPLIDRLFFPSIRGSLDVASMEIFIPHPSRGGPRSPLSRYPQEDDQAWESPSPVPPPSQGTPPLIFHPYVVFSLHNCYFIGAFETSIHKNL